MRIRVLLLSAALLLGGSLAQATDSIEDTPENRLHHADRYFQAVPFESYFGDVVGMLRNFDADLEATDLLERILAEFDMDAVRSLLLDAMVDVFTAAELSALADFYASEVGRSAMAKMGVYMQRVAPDLYEEMNATAQRVLAEMRESGEI